MPAVPAFAARGKVKADIELQPLSAINEVLRQLERVQVTSRIVIDFTVSQISAAGIKNLSREYG